MHEVQRDVLIARCEKNGGQAEQMAVWVCSMLAEAAFREEQFDEVRHTQTCHYQTSSLTGLNRRITVQVGGKEGDGFEEHIYN